MANTQEAKTLRSKIDLRAVISKLGEIRTVNKKDGGTINVRDGSLVDDAGEVKLTLWGDDCTKFSDGDRVELKNGFSTSFKGEISLSKGKYGSLEKVQ